MPSLDPKRHGSRSARAARLAAAGGVVGTFVVLGAWQACAIYDTSLLLPGDAGPDAIVDAPNEASPAPDAGPDAPPCVHTRWPSRPLTDDPSTNADLHVIAALDDLDIGIRPDGGATPAYGFDLDDVCTCPGPETCVAPASASIACDESGGRDNVGGGLLRALGSFKIFDQDSINSGIVNGRYGLVIQLRAYNGEANDTRVTVAAYVSNGVNGSADAGAVAHHDGNDHWTVDPGSLIAGKNVVGKSCDNDSAACVPLYFDDNAYVANHVLVGNLDFPLSLGTGAGIGTVILGLSGSIVTATLTHVNGAGATSFRLENGQLAGRWSTAKLLASLASLTDPFDTSGASYVCGDDATYVDVKKRICSSADIASDSKLDGTNAPCDALSVSLGFTAGPAKLGEVFAVTPPKAGCVTDAGRPFEDDCPH